VSERAVLVAGASGFAGALAAELVWRHPGLDLIGVTARSDVGARLDRLYPQYGVPLTLDQLDPDRVEGVDAAIVAYPHGAAAPVVAALRRREIKVVDLSADFRLRDLDTYRRWYGEHPAPDLVEGAAYGLPELHRERIAAAGLVANPGCYPTATVLALAPLAEAGLIEDVVVDAKSGVSGAGRGAAGEMEVVKSSDDVRPYKVGGHRHSPEISQELAALGANGASITFVPHLLPFDQGELVSCYVRTSGELSAEELRSAYERRYGGERFVQLTDTPPGVSDVRGTNLCLIHLAIDEASGRVMVFAAIDNLWKGAASQAVQNLNLMLGLPEAEGIG
jgi:N-acetyl-gamma-glutamyl-phosphate reductase